MASGGHRSSAMGMNNSPGGPGRGGGPLSPGPSDFASPIDEDMTDVAAINSGGYGGVREGARRGAGGREASCWVERRRRRERGGGDGNGDEMDADQVRGVLLVMICFYNK